MTAVGKVLVFFNLVFSVVICAMIVQVYVARTNWVTAYKSLEEKAIAKSAEAEAEVNIQKSKVAAQRAEIGRLAKQLSDQTGEVARLEGELRDANTQLSTKNRQYEEQSDTTKTITDELKRIERERDQLKQRSDQQAIQIVSLTNQLNEQRDVANATQLKYESVREKNEKLVESNETLTRENRRLRFQIADGGPTPSGGGRSVLSPERTEVPRNVEGRIHSVNGATISINIGRDSGIQPGAVLDVFRRNLNNPSDSRYFGKLTIQESDAKVAVGRYQPYPGVRETPVAGDTVGIIDNPIQ